MKQEGDLIVKISLSNGVNIAAYAGANELTEMVCHPKFIRMRGDKNELFVSIEDIAAFEIEPQTNQDEHAQEETTNIPETPM